MSDTNSNKPVRKPVVARRRALINPDEAFTNKLAIPEAIKKDLAEKGLEAHWVDSKKLYENGGYHDRDWVPYVNKEIKSNPVGFKFGNDPDGVLRRGSLILAVKTKDQADVHRAHLSAKAERYAAVTNRRNRDEIKQLAKESRGTIRVYEEGDEEFGDE